MSNTVLHSQGLVKAFKGPEGIVRVLNEVDLSVREGESVSVRGESGAGKTTLLYLISALETPDRGELLWQGEHVFKRSATWRARRRAEFLGFVFQAYYLIPELNALENVLIARRLLGRIRREDRQRAEELLERVGLAERMQHNSGQLSGGECQRVALARALFNRPALLLADEPTGNLDEHTGEEVMALLLGLCRNEKTALVLVTHNPEFASQTDSRLFLRAGAIQGVQGTLKSRRE